MPAAIEAALEFLAGEPDLALLLVGEPPLDEPAIAAYRAALVDRLAARLASARSKGSAMAGPAMEERHLVEGAFARCDEEIVLVTWDRDVAQAAERVDLALPVSYSPLRLPLRRRDGSATFKCG